MSHQIAKRWFSVDEYYRMAEAGILTEDDRVELIEGEIIEMSRRNLILRASNGSTDSGASVGGRDDSVPDPCRLTSFQSQNRHCVSAPARRF